MEPYPRIRAYYERTQARPAWQRTLGLYAERVGVSVDDIRQGQARPARATLRRMRTASCSCGQLGAICEGEPVRVSMCHCLACQKRTGSVFGVVARWPSDRVTIEGHAQEYVRVGDEGSAAT